MNPIEITGGPTTVAASRTGQGEARRRAHEDEPGGQNAPAAQKASPQAESTGDMQGVTAATSCKPSTVCKCAFFIRGRREVPAGSGNPE